MSDERRPLILVIEDDADMMMLVERILQKGGYDAAKAASGDEALALLESAEPDLILTDVMMPKMNGYELCARLQGDPELALIPVIFLTALDSEQDKARALSAGAVDYLTKPIQKATLLDTVGKHARTRGKWAELKQGMVAAAWAPRREDLAGFHRALFDALNVPEAQRALPPAAAAGLYAIGPYLHLSDAQIAERAAAFRRLEYLPQINPDSIQLGVLPAPFCRANRVIAIQDQAGRAFVVADPFNKELLALLSGYAPEGASARVLVTEPGNIASLLRRPDRKDGAPENLDALPIIEIATGILDAAVRARASDIHIEPKEGRTVVRYRVDGDMREMHSIKPETGLMLITRFKALGSLDVAERRKPQDGSLQTEIDGRVFIIRLATTCTPAGESLILRLLEPWARPKPLEELGMASSQVQHMIEFARRNHGLLIVAGPTGSGKTTTIYSLLQHIDCKTRSLISVEDPVEYRIPAANQQQVDEKAGLTFEALLKSSLRQDPDILFLGEMRDPFSAKMAIDFSSTGHLTISSIHTTNATTAVFRLERLGVTRGAMADSILGVVAQKLLKRLCGHCRQIGPITAEERGWLAPFTRELPERVARPKGCERCGGSGYFGREGVYEIVKFYPEISEMIRRDQPISAIREFARERGDLLITDHAVEKVRALVFSPRDVYEHVLLEESEYRRAAPPRAAPAPAPGPAAPAAPAVGAPRPRGAPAIIEGGMPRILVVEDDPDTQALIQRILEIQGYRVTIAGNGVQALEELGRGSFELILSDIDMPGMDGLKLMELKIQKGIPTPVIFFTGQLDAEAAGLGLGAEDYIKKPVAKEVLLARVKRALGRKP